MQINCKGKLLDLDRPKIMGILNVTPDSFYDGGKHNSLDAAIFQAEKMLKEGADILDVGGMSSRPGAAIISVEEELKRVIPIVQQLSKQFPETILSIDTVHAKVAREAIEAGSHIINDISAGSIDNDMFKTVGELNVPYVLMHMKGQPKDMQENPNYNDDVLIAVMDFFIKKIEALNAHSVTDIILDVGFGFGKKIEDNYKLLKGMDVFNVLAYPILAGLSRKSMIYKLLDIQVEQALNGTSVLHLKALQQGGRILRVHDVREAKEVVVLFEAMV